MTSYTKYHKKYRENHKEKINAYRVRKYHERKYGIPAEMYDLYAKDDHRRYYIQFNKLLAELNLDLLQMLIDNFKNNT